MIPPQVTELEGILQQLVGEHHKLLLCLDSQQSAMRKLDTKAMEELAGVQENLRLRIASLENRRRVAVIQLARVLRLDGQPTLARIAAAVPEAKSKLLELREQLKAAVGQVSSRATVAGRVASAVLGHLNTAVRLLAGAVEKAGLYTRQGMPQVSGRIGVIEAVA